MNWWLIAVLTALFFGAVLALVPAYAAFDHNPQDEFIMTGHGLGDKSLSNAMPDLFLLYAVCAAFLSLPALIVILPLFAILRRKD